MAETKIEWVIGPDGSRGHTVNPIRFKNIETGKVGHYCEKISAGCANCYASRMQSPYLSGLEYVASNRSKGSLFLDEAVLESVQRRRKPTGYFWCDMTDLFGDWVHGEWIDRCLDAMSITPHHRHYVLTKRPERARGLFLAQATRRINLPESMWLGVSVEDRKALARVDHLRATPAAVRFLSVEPLLEQLGTIDLSGIDWVIVGGESGPGARPMHPDWARSIRDQCLEARVPFFFKQWGEWLPAMQDGALGVRAQALNASDVPIRVGKKAAGRLLDGVEWNQYPEVTRG